MQGRLYVIGLGPGDHGYLTEDARRALETAQDLIGYAPYVARLPQREGQTRLASDNRVELERAREALRRTAEGRQVALVSGGDPGVFAMAAAVFEAIETGDPAWRRARRASAAGRLGDARRRGSARRAARRRFLRDLALRQSETLGDDRDAAGMRRARRLRHRALQSRLTRAPRPHQRRFRHFARKSSPETLVVFAKSVGRAEEEFLISDLAGADLTQVDMATLVIVGAKGTRLIERQGARPFVYTSRRVP